MWKFTNLIFENRSHFSRLNSSVFFFSSFDKVAHQSSNFQIFHCLRLKLTKFLMSFFKRKVSFSLNIALPFSVMTHNVCNFLVQHYIPWAKKFLKAQILRLLSVLMKFINIFLSIMKTQIIFPLKFVSIFSMITHNSSVLFWLKHNIL